MKLVIESKHLGEGLMKVQTTIDDYTPKEAIPLLHAALDALKHITDKIPVEDTDDE